MSTHVKIGKKEFYVPQSWNKLSLRDVLQCYNIIMSNTGSWISPVELLPFKKLLLVKYLLKLSQTFMEQWEQDCIQEHGKQDGQLVFISELDEVLQIADFLFERLEHNEVAISLTYTNIPYPYLEGKKKNHKKTTRLYGPKSKLENITLYELGYTFQVFEKFIETQEEQYADQLIAALYRPMKPRTKENQRTGYYGDIRMPLYKLDHMVAKRQEITATLPAIVKRIIIFWFASCRQQIIQGYENIFKKPDDSRRHVGNDYGWGGILLGLSDGIANMDQVANRPYADGLIYLSYLEDQRKVVEMWGK
ncbi:hypothetical protein [Flavilitoribacter nigricans]|uniref:Uncharacterized protein n=1 Tax=Flavilitoribacter nigricans (strain ATCC 23147 / DSM 23189 / NBRC 102662 / NCIMB 1420 / SS-2) TaxID=1122177 RepID=A0A2D0NEK5_FLAN2|nr:hypothetical protein [Flavilitoribacter nigricans]PHN06944.1 hypothetical protein CRP01_09010 [Flavilitoribacter nigricans DSM 23189 = NBRC 102662]